MTQEHIVTRELRIAYTRGRKLHAGTFEPGRKVGRTLCGHFGYRHPSHDDPQIAVGLMLHFNKQCVHCIRELEK